MVSGNSISILSQQCGYDERLAKGRLKVTGIDFLAEPISLAKQKATERGLTATFLVMDALAMKDLPEVFDTLIDSGLFHVFGDEDRQRYIDGQASILKPGGRLYLLLLLGRGAGNAGATLRSISISPKSW